MKNIKTIGILGGGQLARMMVLETKRLGFDFLVLDPTPACPAAQVGAKQIIGSFKDPEKIALLAEKVDVITFDIEHVNTQKLNELEQQGVVIRPSPKILDIIQDKLKQKMLLKEAGIPIPRFLNQEDLTQAAKLLGYPFVQKLRHGGYDGQGVLVIKSEEDLKDAFKENFYVEEAIAIEKEIAVLVARSPQGEIKVYPVVEMLFDERANICDEVLCPARIDESLAAKAQEIAFQVIEALGEGAVGIFAVEMFLSKEGDILVNEIAPRPHNSGHFTLDGCITSQFEQHIRAIAGLPLGATDLLIPTMMINLLGEGQGTPVIEGFEEALSLEGVHIHLYGKKEVRPFRKMGHVNIVDRNIDQVVKKAMKVKEILHVKGE